MKDEKQPKHPTGRYEAPRVTSIGGVADLTRGPLSGNIDSIFGGPGGFQPGTS